MAPTPVPGDAKKPPTTWALLGTLVNTILATRNMAMKAIGFSELWRTFMASMKIKASKAKALSKVKELEEAAATEDAAAAAAARRNRRRDVAWEVEAARW